MDERFSDGIDIITKLKQHGFEAYFVGGCVRDYLLNRKIDDIDITTSARPEQIKEVFPKTIHVGQAHSTVIVKQNQQLFEVSTFRGNDKVIGTSLDEDLLHRDFTMNALAMTVGLNIIDPHDWQEDVDKKQIRGCGQAAERFKEDPLRMLRAVRFVAQLGFSIESNTWKDLQFHKNLLLTVASERLSKEIDKLLEGPFCVIAWPLLSVLPLDFIEKMEPILKQPLYLETTLEEKWALLSISHEKQVQPFLLSYQKSQSFTRACGILVDGYRKRAADGWSNRLLYDLGNTKSLEVERIYRLLQPNAPYEANDEIQKQYDKLPIHTRQQLDFNPRTLLEQSKRPAGPWIEQSLRNIEDAVLEKIIANEETSILQWLQKEG
ncbi:CCA tRNA nucleotidyltransferase [Bacillus alkalicellulosilyticus]|uniref:CCA tRNA nucleotidyltransferase n=1 Tax=Alkalihalobacterium alkalicellulosilyticum TaxID=1912214 RepID=UPI0009988F6F|nr:CCA tRNA nucleotidyltransferase [Bacillus alkalicellulosilyticus]